MSALGTPNLRRLIETAQIPARSAEERCDLCGAPAPPDHRHLFDRTERVLLCACRPCSLLFDHGTGDRERYRLVPDRCMPVDIPVDGLPVELAYFVRTSDAKDAVAYYPSPAGPVESLLPTDDWPALSMLEPDVDALIVNRRGKVQGAWIVGIDVAYRLIAIVRVHWRGMSGGDAVWREIDRFFAELKDAELKERKR